MPMPFSASRLRLGGAAVTACVLALSLAQGLPAQHAASRASGAAGRADSSRIARGARRAQFEFEGVRRGRLPVTPSGVAGRCDVQIGRFCYWHEDAHRDPPDEPVIIAEARDRFIARLDSAAGAHPGDDWIAGQRVRYLVEAKRFDSAVAAAAQCGGTAWWCRALGGFALHAGRRFVESELMFDEALTEMPAKERCAWFDVTPLLEATASSRLRRIPCTDRDSVNRVVWALARPLWSREGNDIRTEHFARHTMAFLEMKARSPHDMAWGDDMRELLVRYGWPTAWSREFTSVTSAQAYRVVGHEPSPSFVFVPTARVLDGLRTLDAGAWGLARRDVPSRYAPAYADAFVEVQHQLATFRRGDSMVVVAGWDVRDDTTFESDSVTGSLALMSITGQPLGIARGIVPGRQGALRAHAPWGPALASIEITDTVARRYGRARLTAGAPDDSVRTLALSDLLLLADSDAHVATLDAAIPLVRGGTRIPAGRKVLVFWEVYGLDSASSETLTYAVTVVRRDASWLRRAAERVGLSGPPAPHRMMFSEPSVSSGGIVSRTLAVDLAQLSPGRYSLIVTASLTEQAMAKAVREIEIVR